MSNNIRKLSRNLGIQKRFFREIGKTVRPNIEESDAAMHVLADETKLSTAVIKGSASFYDFLNEASKIQDTLVCQGTACLVTGSADETASCHKGAGKTMCCGYCYQGSALLQRNEAGDFETFYSHKEDLKKAEMPVYNFSETAILTEKVASIASLYEIALQTQETALDELEKSGLRGRGGAGFSFAFKCKACAEEQSDEKYIVCNADEGDPGAFSDRYLLEEHPHKVMAGMYAAGILSGATIGMLYIRFEYPEAIALVEQAIVEFEKLPKEISDKFSFRVVSGAGSYVCGEETALLNSIEGLRPEVRVRPPYPASYGLWGKPTILSNVETFANVPWILAKGGEAFAQIGTKDSKGTKLVSLDSQFVRPGLYEVDFGCSFTKLIYDWAGGFKVEVKALQVGGPLGSVVAVDAIDKCTVSFEGFQELGFALGHAGIIAIPQTFPMIDFMHHLFEYMAEESCGKCVPCRIGTEKGTVMLKNSKNETINIEVFESLLSILEEGSLCALGGGLPLPIRNIMSQFQVELADYFTVNGEE